MAVAGRILSLMSLSALCIAVIGCVGPSKRSEAPGEVAEPGKSVSDQSTGVLPGLGPPTAESPRVARVTLSSKALDLATGGGAVTVSFDVSKDSDAWLDILDEAQRWVRTVSLGRHPAGRVSGVWDGRDAQGLAVTPGVYLYRIRAVSTDGHPAAYGAEPVGGGVEILARRFTYRRGAPAMSFVLPEPSRVRLRIGLRELPHLRTIYDWQPMEAGLHTVEWDGLDAAQEIRLGTHPNVRFSLTAYSLPENSVIVKRGDEPAPRRPVGSERPEAPFRHAQHSPEICHEVAFSVSFLESRAGTDGAPVVGPDPIVRIGLLDEDAATMAGRPYEILLHLDTVFLTEDEEGTDPFNYVLRTSDLAPGRHLLTVNVVTYDGHAGVVSVPFVFEQPEAKARRAPAQ